MGCSGACATLDVAQGEEEVMPKDRWGANYLGQDNVSLATRRLIRSLWIMSLVGIFVSFRGVPVDKLTFFGIVFEITTGQLRWVLIGGISYFFISSFSYALSDRTAFNFDLRTEYDSARQQKKSRFKYFKDEKNIIADWGDLLSLLLSFKRFEFSVCPPLLLGIFAIWRLYYWSPVVISR